MTWVHVPDEITQATREALRVANNANTVYDGRKDEYLLKHPNAVQPMPFGIPHPDGKTPDPQLTEWEAERMAAWDAVREVERSYFRLNIWGMSICRELMHEHGMLAMNQPDTTRNWPEFPEPEDEHFDDDEGAITDEGRAYIKARNALLAATSDEPGIGIWKLGSNDGWIVTPEEIHQALACAPETVKTLDDDGAQVEVQWWPDWLRFLREAAEIGDGFRVF